MGAKLIIKFLCGVLMFVAVYVLADYSKMHSPNKDDAKLKEIEQLYSTIPTYPGFTEVADDSYSKDLLASVHRYYKSDTPYEDVKRFYSQHLQPKGWQLTRERNLKDWWIDKGGRELTFHQGKYRFVIEYWGDKATDPDWRYGISLGWHRYQ